MTSASALLAAIDATCRAVPHRPALGQAGGRAALSYAELGRELTAITSGLLRAGLARGDAVVFSIRPSPEAILLLLAIVRCGGVVVAADPGMAPTLFATRMALVRSRWVMAESVLYALASLRPARALLERRGVRLPNLDVPGARLVLTGRRLPWQSGALAY